MIGNVVGVRTPRWAFLSVGLLTCITMQAASAADCPGHPDALGTSRTLVVDPREHPRIGTMQYPETLPLGDHEVVLTFDDGPLPRNSNQILEILAAQCVKATFFTIGSMAKVYPAGVRKLRDAGHSIGTHTQNHPLSMNRMAIDRAKQEIDDGIASVKAALGDAPAPFFRVPGLLRADGVEEYLASQGIQTWSADFPADDWRHIPSSRVYDLAMQRIEAKGKGILLLHDIQARTVAALPRILSELKARGYRIVHVVPATPERPATPTEPQQWLLHPPSEPVAISHWPKIPNFVFASTDTLAAPARSDLNWQDGRLMSFAEPFDSAQRRAHEARWPRQSPLRVASAAITLPIPAPSMFEIMDMPRTAGHAAPPSSSHAEQAVLASPEADSLAKLISADASDSRRAIRGKPRLGHARQFNASQVAGRRSRPAAHARRGTSRHLIQVKRTSA
jgi:peptidoglycan/xylan/chitin deacetylase (PgdA/CDA1 family)